MLFYQKLVCFVVKERLVGCFVAVFSAKVPGMGCELEVRGARV